MVFLVTLQWQEKEYLNLDVFRSLCTAALVIRSGSYFYPAEASIK